MKEENLAEMIIYKIYNRGYTVSFDLIDDLCNGRIKSTMGFWVRTNHDELISDLNTIIENSNNIQFILNRARMYLALGKTKLAKKDFDSYTKRSFSADAKSFTLTEQPQGFHTDLKGIVYDCNRHGYRTQLIKTPIF